MIPVGNNKTAKELDELSVKEGISSLILMENAAFSLYQTIKEELHGFSDNVCVFTGSGGNGGDGAVLLRILTDRIPELNLFHIPVITSYQKGSDAEINFSLIPERVKTVDTAFFSEKKEPFLFVDAILGSGSSREISGKTLEAVNFINNYPSHLKKVIAVDIPTGLCGNTGNLMPVAVKSDITVSLGILKQGLFLEHGINFAGKIVHGLISMPEKLKNNSNIKLLEKKNFKLSEISLDSYKNKNGHVLFIAGNDEKLGAIIISAKTFMASGGGLATLALNKEMIPHLAGKIPALMLKDIEKVDNLDKYSGFVIGPGLVKKHEIIEKIPETKGFAVADAGMFDLFAEDEKLLFKYINFRTVFTPHPGELKRIIKNDSLSYFERVEKFPLSQKSILAAKNSASVIKSKENFYIIPSGAKALAFGGTGDMLTGIIAAMMNGKNDTQNVINALLLHRECGILLEETASTRYHSIEKLLESIPTGMERLSENNQIKRNPNNLY